MARKFISFLGTGNYLETYYILKGQRSSHPVRFVQEALVDFLCADWNEKDSIIVFCTKDARDKNWLDNGHTNATDDKQNVGLNSRLKAKGYKPLILGGDDALISEGFSESQIWDIFEVVYSKIDNDDQIYFDLTHAFRSIPVFSTILFSYAHFLKNTELISVHYGALEQLGDRKEVEKMAVEMRNAPIIDLTGLITLQSMTISASSYFEFGRFSEMGKIISDPNNKKGQSNKASNRLQEAMHVFRKNIADLEAFISTCRMSDIRKGLYAVKILSSLNHIVQSELPLPEQLLLQQLKQDIERFSPEPSDKNIEVAIEWAFKYNMLQQSYTLGQEYIISLTSLQLQRYSLTSTLLSEKGLQLSDRELRMYVSSLLGIDDKHVRNIEFEGLLKKNPKITLTFLEKNWIQQLRPSFKLLADNRNIINHAKGNTSAAELKDQFRVSYDNCKAILVRVAGESVE